jgi:ribbon-helix-helix CopG family protein
MATVPKLKVSLTLSSDLVALVDRDARRLRDTRSSVVEQWLRRAANTSTEREIAEATIAYYRSLRDEERAEEEALSRALSRVARRVPRDEVEPRRRRRAVK